MRTYNIIEVEQYKKMKRKKHKYNAQKVRYAGCLFDSIAEKDRYIELLALQRAGEIVGLKVHPVFKLEVNGVMVGKYIPDFIYINKQGETIVEDVKGYRTRLYVLKAKIFKAIYGQTHKLVEVKAK